MLTRRLPSGSRRGGPWLALGVAAALVAVPGVAEAQTPSDPVPVITPGADPAGPLLDQLNGQTQQGSTGTSTSADSSTPAQQHAATQDTSTVGTPAPPSPPPQLQQLLDQLPSNSPCSAAVQADVTRLATDIPTFVQSAVTYLADQLTSGSPPDPQQMLDQLTGLLQGQHSAAAAGSGPSPDPTVILTDLQQLVTDLTTTCAPAPPGLPSSPPGSQPQAQVVSRPQAALPVSYPGYAPTGSIATVRPAGDQWPADPVPLSALGAVLLVSTAAAVGVRSRARRGGR